MPLTISSDLPAIDIQMPLAEPLLTLAPTHLPNYRQERYQGDDLCVSLDQTAGHDQTLLRDFYESLTELLYTIADASTDDAQKWAGVHDWIARHELDGFIDRVHELGAASRARGPSESLSKALHDVRGGALSALLGRLQLIARLPRDTAQLQALFVLTRDHLKIMRSAVVGLDEQRRQADRQPKRHDMNLILEKWHESVVGPKWQERPVRMYVDCRYEGPLTECCLESAAIDRIFYNLANNACRHSAGERLDMAIFPIPQPPGECLRFVLSNEVDEADAAYLSALTQADGADSADRGRGLSLLALFEPAVSTTGSGFGLTVAADFVAGAFGLRNRQQALRERYIGAILEDRTFRAWFHWPIANESLTSKLDDYHQPRKSLTEP